MSYPKPLSSMEEFDKHKSDSTIHVTPAKVSNWDAKVDSSDYVKSPGYGIAVQTAANVYAVTLSPAPTAYTDGMGVVVKIPTNSTAATSINVNTLGPRSILKANGGAVTNLKANAVYHLRYNGSNFILLGEGGEYGTATASQVLAGYTVGTENGLVTGTIPSKGASTITPGTTNQTIAAGQYLSGAQTIVGDPDLIPDNIVSGVNIFGVVGTAERKQLLPGSTYSVLQRNYRSDPWPTSMTYYRSLGEKITTNVKGKVQFNIEVSGGRSDNGTKPSNFRIYKNGAPVGQEYSVSVSKANPIYYSQVLDCDIGDEFQVYGKSYDGSWEARLHLFSVTSANDTRVVY